MIVSARHLLGLVDRRVRVPRVAADQQDVQRAVDGLGRPAAGDLRERVGAGQVVVEAAGVEPGADAAEQRQHQHGDAGHQGDPAPARSRAAPPGRPAGATRRPGPRARAGPPGRGSRASSDDGYQRASAGRARPERPGRGRAPTRARRCGAGTERDAGGRGRGHVTQGTYAASHRRLQRDDVSGRRYAASRLPEPRRGSTRSCVAGPPRARPAARIRAAHGRG